ncbi:ATP-dependent DNA ligase [Streptomyces rishiriensis]|uniref:ATP-dependent DNA ligase n=1 Tax=Streptomyces rishiriensis TaxID=68264 RepID=UPI000D591A51|nr:hypothetical protein [Streptomyces rishiriensis]
MLPEPMLAEPVADPALPDGWAGEVKWDGWRALLSWDAGRLVLRSRRGADLVPGFPELHSGALQLPDATALDGEVVVWESGRLAFERLQGRLQRRGAGAARLAEQWPAHYVAFDVLRLEGTDTTTWPYRRRRAALERPWGTSEQPVTVAAVPVGVSHKRPVERDGTTAPVPKRSPRSRVAEVLSQPLRSATGF